MNIANYLEAATKQLSAADIGTPRLDVLVMLEDCLKLDRAHLLAHPEITLSPEHTKTLDEHLNRRINHEPLAYIRGRTEFYGRNFSVNQDVLEPRSESETMINLLKTIVETDSNLLHQKEIRIADIGSGSGCLGITAVLELPHATLTCIDIDPRTLKVAQTNAETYHVCATFLQSNLLASKDTDSSGPFDILLCNLPYVPDSFHINQAATHEPNIAIFGGHDGLDLYRQLFLQLSAKVWKPSHVLTEALPPQHDQLVAIAGKYGFSEQLSDDFIQVFSPE